jgi:hypothetical protein
MPIRSARTCPGELWRLRRDLDGERQRLLDTGSSRQRWTPISAWSLILRRRLSPHSSRPTQELARAARPGRTSSRRSKEGTSVSIHVQLVGSNTGFASIDSPI